MKKLIFVFFILPYTLLSQSQSSNIHDPASLDSVVYDLTSTTLAPREISLPFKKIEVLDARFDTSKLGFTFNRKSSNLTFTDFKKIKLKGGIAKGIQDYYNDYYQLCLGDSADQLLIVLKKLWIDNLPNREFISERNESSKNSFQDIHIKLEYYLHRGNEFYPLVRVDTIHQITEENQNAEGWIYKNNGLAFFNYSLKAVIEKYDFYKLVTDAAGRKKLSFIEIDSFNAKRFRLPALTTANHKEGLYRNIKEFINNEPSSKNYKLNKKGNVVFDKNEENSYYWAFADSSGLHLISSKKVDLFRVGNTFEFFTFADFYSSKFSALDILGGGFTYTDYSKFRMGGFPAIGAFKSGVKNYPRQIDMETGEIY